MAVIIGDMSTGLRPAQSGILRTYTTIFLVGVIVILGIVLIFG